MQIDKDLISRLEHLARLELSESEKDQLRGDLNNILILVEKLQELDTDQVEPLVYINEEVNVWREDEVQGQVDRHSALQNAPQASEEFFIVPKIIDL
ncbi:MAG TPA: Asp-tRNA(Asn)/Glu-tRNA(Gln) amidotransferase subunit GatC [Saprospiraceae bacterium]|nr:Asp-tRNA(Asn)/Glu-tRNA(Gln) amidotransferase subunit GatC [Saprospiraceae bacterium]HMQ85324.1 Asp-tRNA(Asn)/Glu-tRNA(Gln) amidotransferase subunit GatC [Saprospiraceae bacterium]